MPWCCRVSRARLARAGPAEIIKTPPRLAARGRRLGTLYRGGSADDRALVDHRAVVHRAARHVVVPDDLLLGDHRPVAVVMPFDDHLFRGAKAVIMPVDDHLLRGPKAVIMPVDDDLFR